MLRRITALILILLVSSFAISKEKYEGVYGSGSEKLLLATGSPGELGLVKVLAEEFSVNNKVTVYWIKAGTGDALDLLKNKSVDMVMVHGPEAENKALKEGWAVQRVLIGSNEFFIVGPSADPAGISKAKSAAEAYTLIAKNKSKFYSRGDNSGTHKKELEIWKKAGIQPSGDWYIISKGFMAETLKKANDEQGYFMTDSSTWIAFKKDLPGLKVLFKGDKMIINTYHTLRNPDSKVAARFIDFVSSSQGQKIIRDFGKKEYGEGLYNDAAYAEKYDK